MWRTHEYGPKVTLIATRAAFEALGIDGAEMPAHLATATPHRPRRTRANSKQAQLIEMLRRPEGATIAQIVVATGWQPHAAESGEV